MKSGSITSQRPIRPLFVAAAAVAVTALALRPGATSIGPILAELQADLGVDGAQLGVLTGLPGFAFALVGFYANRLTPRLGMVGSLAFASGLMAVGLALRVFTSSWLVFLLFTFIALSGMAIGNVLLPAFIKAAFPSRATAMSTTYTTFLAVGATLPTAFAVPMLQFGDSILPEGKGWKLPVGFWVVVALLALALWSVLIIRNRANVAGADAAVKVGTRRVTTAALFRSPTAVALATFFGLQSMQAYIQFGWVAQMYRDGGVNASTSSLMVTIIAIGGIPGGLLMPRLVADGRGLKPVLVLLGALLAVGYLGIAFAPTTLPWLWALSLSISGFCFSAALAMILARTRDATITSAVSGFVQPVGYLAAAIGPLLVGAAYGWLGQWKPILVVLACTSLIMASAGLVAARNRYIDDEVKSNSVPEPMQTLKPME